MILMVSSVFFILLVGVFIFWRFYFFFRDPNRIIPQGEERLVAAADGYITYIKVVKKGQVPIAIKKESYIALHEFQALDVTSQENGYLIGTYMTEFSVHRNRAPISGNIVLRHHQPAPRNLSMVPMISNLMFSRKPEDKECEFLIRNERLTIGIQTLSGAIVTVTQIADVWINRIVANVFVGDYIKRGQQYGMIRFGSQCDVFIPKSLSPNICVKPGNAVKAGESVLAVIDNHV